MKTVLHKPQRMAKDFVLAYDGEGIDYEYEHRFGKQFLCNEDTGECEWNKDAGGCRQWGRVWEEDGEVKETANCKEWSP